MNEGQSLRMMPVKPVDDPKACVKGTFFELTQIAPTDLSLIRKVVLR